MAKIIKLTSTVGNEPLWINVDTIETMFETDKGTHIYTTRHVSDECYIVKQPARRILEAASDI